MIDKKELISLRQFKNNEEALFKIFDATIKSGLLLSVFSISLNELVTLPTSEIQKIRSAHPNKAKIIVDTKRTSINNYATGATSNRKIHTTEPASFMDLWGKESEIQNLVALKVHISSEIERNTLLKLILGMAISRYEYDPDKDRNAATGYNKHSIKDDLSKLGLHIDEDTVRKYLKEAKEQYPNVRPREQKII